MNPNKKNLPLIVGVLVVLLLLVGAGVFAYTKMAKKTDAKPQASAAPKKRKITEPANVIPVNERPYITLAPKDGRSLVLTVEEVKKTATTMDYELEYQTESNLEGAVGSLELASLPVSKDILLGSCSAGGACRYHKDVKGGTLLGKFAGTQNYVLKQDWNYIENTTKKSSFSSKDQSFTIDSKDLSAQRILIIYNTPGYPKTPAGTVISDIYSVTGVGALSGKATVSIKISEAASSATVMGWDGTSWKEYPATVSNQMAKAEVDVAEVYLVVKK